MLSTRNVTGLLDHLITKTGIGTNLKKTGIGTSSTSMLKFRPVTLKMMYFFVLTYVCFFSGAKWKSP
jgi:hypothetical protein